VARRTLSNVFTVGTGVASAGAGQFVLNGLGQSATSISMDGIDASANPQAPQAQLKEGFNYISVVSMEAVQEVQVSKGVFSAEYGRTLGGNVNVITKSGTNAWHGGVFELFNAEDMNSRQQFLKVKPGTTFNQYGGSFGGRIIRNRAFFFGALEGYQERSAATVQGNVPTPKLRGEMTAAVPAYKLVLDNYPLPNEAFAATADTAAYIGSGSVSSGDLSLTLRPDIWVKANRLLLTGTYVRSRPDRTVPRVLPTNPQMFRGVTERFNITATYIGGPNWTSETRFGYNRNDRDRIDGYWDLKDPNKPESAYGGRRLPILDFLGVSTSSEYNIIGRAPHRSIDQKIARNTARHSIKFGGLAYIREIGSVNIQNPLQRYQNKADLLANIPSLEQFTLGRADFDARGVDWGLFLQDDFRISPKLTLNLGLRYDVFGHFTAHGHGQEGRSPYIFNFSSLSLPNFVAGSFRPFDNPYDSDRFNLGPRFGFAYNPDGRSKTVVRGGFAVMFTAVSGELAKNMVQNGADEPFRVQFSRADALALGVRFPAYNEDVLKLVKSGIASPSFQYLDPHTKAPYSMNFSLTLERALSSTLALETAAVGTRGVKFQMVRFYNEINRVTGIRPNPTLSVDRYWDGSDSTHYYSWQNSLRKRFSHGFTANLHYTWAKAIGYNRGDMGAAGGNSNIQDFFDIRANKGPSENDITHSLTADFVYETPRLKNIGRLGRSLVGSWMLSGLFTAQTGTPLVLSQATALQVQRPDLINPAAAMNGDWRSTLHYLNPSAFAAVPLIGATGAAARPGSAGNGVVRSPGLWNFDFGLAKVFPVTEAVRLQIRGEFLNSLNHTNFTSVDTNILSSRFGQLTGTAGARTIQIQMRLSF
jgi:hypothetical protein